MIMTICDMINNSGMGVFYQERVQESNDNDAEDSVLFKKTLE